MAELGRAQGNARRLERAIAKRRRHAPSVCTVVVARATRVGPQAFEAIESETCALARLRTKLLAAEVVLGERTRRSYYVSEACDGAALIVAPRRDGAALPFAARQEHGRAEHKLPLFVCKPDDGRANVPLFETGETMNWCIAVRRYNVDGAVVFALCRGDGNASPLQLSMSRGQVRDLQRDAARLLGLRVLCEWAL